MILTPKNIIMSGGSCSTTGLRERLTKELQKRVDKRYNETASKSKIQSKPIEINVHESPYDNFAVWNGGSMIATSVILFLLGLFDSLGSVLKVLPYKIAVS
jgi:actin-related protein